MIPNDSWRHAIAHFLRNVDEPVLAAIQLQATEHAQRSDPAQPSPQDECTCSPMQAAHGHHFGCPALHREASLQGGGDGLTIADYEESFASHRKLVRELDVLLNGEAGAAKQASLCDIVSQVESEGIRSPQHPAYSHPTLLARLAELEAEVLGLREDAMRYRWLRSKDGFVVIHKHFRIEGELAEYLDDLIDFARQSMPGQGGESVGDPA